MATLTIRNLPDGVRERIQREAVVHGRSMEAEVRFTLSERYRRKLKPKEVSKLIADLHAKIPPLPTDAKIDRIDRYAVSLPEVQAFFEEKWPWTPKS